MKPLLVLRSPSIRMSLRYDTPNYLAGCAFLKDQPTGHATKSDDVWEHQSLGAPSHAHRFHSCIGIPSVYLPTFHLLPPLSTPFRCVKASRAAEGIGYRVHSQGAGGTVTPRRRKKKSENFQTSSVCLSAVHFDFGLRCFLVPSVHVIWYDTFPVDVGQRRVSRSYRLNVTIILNDRKERIES